MSPRLAAASTRSTARIRRSGAELVATAAGVGAPCAAQTGLEASGQLAAPIDDVHPAPYGYGLLAALVIAQRERRGWL